MSITLITIISIFDLYREREDIFIICKEDIIRNFKDRNGENEW